MFHLFTKIDSISTSELEAKLKKPIQLLDVRTPMEFCRGHIKMQKCSSNRIGSLSLASNSLVEILSIFVNK